jgi:hypothetical protein
MASSSELPDIEVVFLFKPEEAILFFPFTSEEALLVFLSTTDGVLLFFPVAILYKFFFLGLVAFLFEETEVLVFSAGLSWLTVDTGW